MEEAIQFSVGQTAPSLTCSIMEKPHTGFDECPRILLSCFRAGNSVSVYLSVNHESIRVIPFIHTRNKMSMSRLPLSTKSWSNCRAKFGDSLLKCSSAHPKIAPWRNISASKYRTEGENRNILLPTIRIKYFVVNLYNLGQQKGNELGL